MKYFFSMLMICCCVAATTGQATKFVYMGHSALVPQLSQQQKMESSPSERLMLEKMFDKLQYSYRAYELLYVAGKSVFEFGSGFYTIKDGVKSINPNSRSAGTEYKTYKDAKTHQSTTDIYSDQTTVVDFLSDFAWQCSDEKKKIANFECIKCTGYSCNDTLTAWYSNEIPISEGPLIYGGLPGLIVSLQIKQGKADFTYFLDEIQTIKASETPVIAIPTPKKTISWCQHLGIKENNREKDNERILKEAARKKKSANEAPKN